MSGQPSFNAVTHPRTLAMIAFVGLLLSGCISIQPGEPRPAPGGLGEEAAAPTWRVGDWWTYRFTSDIYRFDERVTIVVGRAGADGYVLGMPAPEYRLSAILHHVPPLGRLSPGLAYPVHDVPYEPFHFPLAEGAAWDTHWVTSPVRFAVHEIRIDTPDGPGQRFHITNEATKAASGRLYESTYAPTVGWFTHYAHVDLDGRVRYRLELLVSGHDFRGPVRLLDGVTMVFLETRTTGLLDNGQPAAPTVAFTPKATVDTIFAACVLGDQPGHYRVQVRSPRATVCDYEDTLAPGQSDRRYVMREVPSEPGAWDATMVAGGTGIAVAEVLGYRAWDETLGAAGDRELSSG